MKFGSAEIPEDFPSGVAAPRGGTLRSVVAEKNPPNASYTMTYSLGGKNGERRRQRSTAAGSSRRASRSSTTTRWAASDGEITQFDAIGKKWDVAVVSGKASPRDRATLSVQVNTHGSVTSGISGIGNTEPDDAGNSGAEIRPPASSSTSTTTSG